jgi:hypothetical protein
MNLQQKQSGSGALKSRVGNDVLDGSSKERRQNGIVVHVVRKERRGIVHQLSAERFG